MGAHVSLICENHTYIRTTDEEGHFTFARNVFPPNCKIEVAFPGFATLELTLGQGRNLALELKLAEVRQTVVAQSELISFSSIASLSLSGRELKNVSDNSDDLLAYAKQLAGVYFGADHIYVDGLPADRLPPADRIESITINADPFSAEYSDATGAHIDIRTKNVDRPFHLSTGGISLGTTAKSSSNAASLGLSGAVPGLPLAFTSDVHLTNRRTEVPMEAMVPFVKQYPISLSTAASAPSSNLLFGLGADYSDSDALRVNLSLYGAATKNANMNVSGLTLPDAGIAESTTAREFRTTITKSGSHYLFRGGIITDWLIKDLKANSTALGVSVSGAFLAGGAQTSSGHTRATSWIFKNVLAFDAGKHYWSVGVMISRKRNDESITPNPVGYIQFDNSENFILSATTGAHTGTALITRGQGNGRYISHTVGPFVEGEILRRSGASIRGGLRADYQTGGGMRLSPRLSAIAAPHGFIFRAGSGMFVKNWSNDTFLRIMENDGQHLRQFVMANASLFDVEGAMATPAPEIVSKIAQNLTPARDWVSKVSVEHPCGNFLPAVEYTWTNGTHLLGSQRVSVPEGWQDLLQSNRSLRMQQLHFRALYKIRRQSIATQYEWIRARDNTDGPFSFPARQDDIRGEWGPSSGVASHNLTLAANLDLGKVMSFTVTDTWHSGLPLNFTTGVDAEHNGLFADRAGGPRNSGRGPAFNSLTLFAHRRIAVPKVFAETKQKIYVDLGVQGLNLLGNKDQMIETILGSPLFGQPLSAPLGRSVRFSLSLQR